jgi:pyochelin biosynthesis protein PchC
MSRSIADCDLWFRNFVPTPEAEVRLICLPHAGGSASFYLPVARSLTPDVEVIAAQYPGRQDRRREAFRSSIGELADELADAVRPWCDRPIALFGHSMGATVAFELARRLERRDDVALLRLFASGRRAPSLPHDDGVHRKDDDGLLRELRALDGTASAILHDEEIMRMALPAIRADYRAAETYEYDGGTPLTTPITVLTGDADPKTSPDQAAAWRQHTEGDFTLETYPGGHFFLTDHVAAILTLIRAELTRALPSRRR